MSLSSSVNKVIFTGDGVTKEFDVPYYVLAEADLKLSIVDIATDVETNITTNYSVAPTGGSFPALTSVITYPVSGDAVTSAYKIVIIREIDVLQPTVYPTNGDFTPKVIEQSFDRITMIAQQQQEELDRSLKIGVVSDESLEALMDTLTASVSAAAGYASSAGTSATSAEEDAASAESAAASAASALADINEAIDLKIASPTEVKQALGTLNVNTSIDCANGNIATATLGADLTLSFTASASTSVCRVLTLILTNGGAHTLTWGSTIKWGGGVIPSLTASGVDVLTFMTVDNGTTWYGAMNGSAFI